MSSTKPSMERSYHGTTSAYVLPNDEIEHDRLDAQATAIVEMIGGRPFLTPRETIKQSSKAVDVGCGTGVATLQLAAMIPNAEVCGVDLSPVPNATKQAAPPNVAWSIGDVLAADSSSLFTPDTFDYVFGRMLFLGVNDWPRYFQTLAQSLIPGGTIEHQDLDWKFYRAGTSDCISEEWEWHKLVVKAAEQSGLSTSAGSDAGTHMQQAGLEVVSVKTFEFSFVPTSKTPNSQAIGKYVQAQLIPQYPELLRKMLGSQGIEGDELARLTAECLRDLASEEGIHQKYIVTIGKK